jgi:pimeloyl-ACP methyl ester carboxylesterase
MATSDGRIGPVSRRSLRLSWGEISYLEWEPTHGEADGGILLLHGGGLDSAALSWGEVGPALAASGHRVVAPDLPGFGRSPAASWTFTQERLVEWVGEIIDGLSWAEPIIGGISLGGGMAVGHALARGETRGLMLLGCYGLMDRQVEGPLAGTAHRATWALLRTGALDAAMRPALRNRRLLALSLSASVRDKRRLTDELVDEVLAAGRLGTNLAAFGQWQRDQFGPTRLRTNYTPRLPGLRGPVLIVHGSRDVGVPVARVRAAAELIPDARLVVVEGAGHWVQRDRPDAVVPAMLSFLAEIGREAAGGTARGPRVG